MRDLTDKDRIDLLERLTKDSWTGVSLERWKDEDNHVWWRVSHHHNLGEPSGSLRNAIDNHYKQTVDK